MQLRQEIWDHGLQRYVTPAAWDEWEDDVEAPEAPAVATVNPGLLADDLAIEAADADDERRDREDEVMAQWRKIMRDKSLNAPKRTP